MYRYILPHIIICYFLMPVADVAWSCEESSCAGTITRLRGSVVVLRPGNGEQGMAREGTCICVSDKIVAGQTGRAQLTLNDGAFLELGNSTTVRINQYFFDAQKRTRTVRGRVLTGSVRVVLFEEIDSGSLFYLETEHAALMAARTADFVVDVTADETTVTVLRGSAQIKNALAYVIGSERAGKNTRVVVRRKESPHSPAALSAEERRTLLKKYTTY
ncbi:MAG: FecR family protein [Nitrospirota bacterium]|nr:FecR family protein [Nitrospirota bacterium]